MSGILEIAPAGIPAAVPLRASPAKNRSIAPLAERACSARQVRKTGLGERMLAKASDLFGGPGRTPRADAPVHDAVHAAQDRAIAEQDSDIAADAPIARISAVAGAARAAVREEAVMPPVATQVANAAKPRVDLDPRAQWWHSLPRLLSRLRRALHAPSAPAADGMLEVAGGRPSQWTFAAQTREFAVSRRRQSGGRARSPRVPRP
jgi:hypothetical protein